MLFVWRSNFLKGYRLGVIAVCASTLAEARIIARSNFDNYVSEHHYCGHLSEDGDLILDEYEREDYDRHKAKFTADIETDPEILDHVFVYGGD